MTRLQLLGIICGVAGWGIFCAVLWDSIRWRYKRRQNIRELRNIGLNVSDDWLNGKRR